MFQNHFNQCNSPPDARTLRQDKRNDHNELDISIKQFSCDANFSFGVEYKTSKHTCLWRISTLMKIIYKLLISQ